MFHLFSSNRYEILRQQMLDSWQCEVLPPFAMREIIVPGSAQARDLQLALAAQTGIAAGLNFSYTGEWLWQQITRLVPVAERSPFNPPDLLWNILPLLSGKWTAQHPRLAHYLSAADDLMRFELAQELAQLFADYSVYRPSWLQAWGEGRQSLTTQDAAWQAELWRQLLTALKLPAQHPVDSFFAVLNANDDAVAQLPPRVDLFCLPTLQPLYLDVFLRLAEQIEIYCHLLNPCQEYWHDIITPKSLARLDGEKSNALYYNQGHPMLAAWGQTTRTLFTMLQERAETVLESNTYHANEASVAPNYANGLLKLSLLQLIQDDILQMRAPTKWKLAQDDRSLEIHVCHSLRRELEVLYDQLLAMLDAPDGPTPSDILVLSPALGSAAPLIEAVFAGGDVPWRISGLGETEQNQVESALLGLLECASGRWTFSEVFELLRLPPVAARFALNASELDSLQTALADAGLHWGLDARHRQSLGLPPGHRHTWRDALERLLIGYALGDGTRSFNGKAAQASFAGQSAVVLGHLYSYIERLEELCQKMQFERPAGQWPAIWRWALNEFIATDTLPPASINSENGAREWETEMGNGWPQAKRRVLATIELLEGRMVFADQAPLSPQVAQAALAAALKQNTHGATPGGEVSFSALGAMRYLPYRVICLLGMNDGAFPAGARAIEFDLIASHPQPGDLQQRADERNIMLDVLLATRQRLYISYTGKRELDNATLPPSSLVNELLDVVRDQCGEAVQQLVVEHPLQPFSPLYFSPDSDLRLFSYSTEWCSALQRQNNNAPIFAVRDAESTSEKIAVINRHDAPFFSRTLPSPDEQWRSPGLSDLQDFLRHSGKYLLRRRMRINLPTAHDTYVDEEPLQLSWPGQRQLASRLLSVALSGASRQQLMTLALKEVAAPAEPVAMQQLESMMSSLHDYAQGLLLYLQKADMPALQLDIEFLLPLDDHGASERWQLRDTIGALSSPAGAMANESLKEDGLLIWRYDNANVYDFINAWVLHLGLNLLSGHDTPGSNTELPRQSWLHTMDGRWRLRPMTSSEARENMRLLLLAYRRGLCQPLAFYPRSAWAMVSNQGSKKEAAKTWFGSAGYWKGECEDRWWQLAERQELDDEFYDWAQKLMQPLYGQLERVA